MKSFNIYSGIICSLFLLATASCDQENIGDNYTFENEGVTFFAAASELLAAPDETSITYEIARGNVSGKLELPIVADYDADIFTLPSTVVFEDGAEMASIAIPLEKTELGVAYSITLAFDSIKSSPFGAFKTTLTVMRDYNWIPAGKVSMTSSWAEATGDVDVEYAEGSNPELYRLVSPYYILEPAYCEKPGYHLQFTLDENYNALEFMSLQPIGESASNGNPILMYGFQGNSFKNTANEFTVIAHFVYVADGSYSGWANIGETFVWKEGYKGEIPEPKLSDFNSLANEEIQGALSAFKSEAYFNSTWDQSFTKIIDQDPENEASQYKNLYYLPDLYADGYGLAFYYDGETITIPENQPAGTSFKKPLYVSQSENIESSVLTTAKDVNIYTLGLNFHYEDGTSVGEFTETFYYSEDPVSYAIADFYGNYKLTGPSQFGEPDADMDVTIVAGASENTFIITGIDLAEEVKATFDPSTSTLSVAPQELADFGPYDITLYTTTPDGEISETAAMDFNFNISGNLVMTATSEADGYLLNSEEAGGWVDGYYNLTFIPQLTEMMKAAKTSSKIVSVHKNLSRKMNTESHSQVKDLSKNNFAVQAKGTVKKMLKKETGLKPLF